jgi:hypothetical protein
MKLHLTDFPDFSYWKDRYWYLDISDNDIQSLENLEKKGVKSFKFINTRGNPLFCKTVPPWTSLHTDCATHVQHLPDVQEISYSVSESVTHQQDSLI